MDCEKKSCGQEGADFPIPAACLLPSEMTVIPLGLHCSYPMGVRDAVGRQTKPGTGLECCWEKATEGEAVLPKDWSPHEFTFLGRGWVSQDQLQSQLQTRTRIRDEAGSGTAGLLQILHNK